MKKTIWLLIIAILLLVISGFLFYAANQKEKAQNALLNSSNIKNPECGNFNMRGEKDSCCAVANINSLTIQCAGSWQFTSDVGCKFVCTAG